ncbi:DDE-type integrase/transposase/recombinase [Corynebacterium pilosum]|uniref:Transposase for insertion sequence n=1 Tax=Corynebacterium pilosum TaxID=35756 RepID=A0A376CKI9_9CORY|nr:transposase for insertion sequence [Corynebacterium pilosum]
MCPTGPGLITFRLIADELADRGYRLSEWRVWRLCHTIGVASVISRRRTRTRRAGDPVHDDLLARHFHTDEINVAWVTDMTEHWTGEGKLYLCAIKDLCSRPIVGYATSARMKSSLAVAALEDAMRKRGEPKGVIVHSGRGLQFGSRKFRVASKAYGAKGSMGRPSTPPPPHLMTSNTSSTPSTSRDFRTKLT